MMKPDDIKSEKQLRVWFENWASSSNCPTIKRKDGSYMDASLNTVWDCLVSLFSEQFSQEMERQNFKHKPVTISDLTSFFCCSEGTFDFPLTNLEVHEHEGVPYLLYHYVARAVPIEDFLYTLNRLPGKIFTTNENKRLVVKKDTEVYYLAGGQIKPVTQFFMRNA